MDNKKDFGEGSVGSLRISKEVIATVSKLATLEVEGVSDVASTANGVKGLARNYYSKPVKIELNDDVVGVDISVIVKDGYSIPRIAETVQQNIKHAVQSMTGLAVSDVNVVVCGIVRE